MVIVAQTEERRHLGSRRLERPFAKLVKFGLISRDFALGNYMAQVMDAVPEDLQFTGFAFQSCFAELSQGSVDDWKDLRKLEGIHRQIIEVRRDDFPDVLSENMIC